MANLLINYVLFFSFHNIVYAVPLNNMGIDETQALLWRRPAYESAQSDQRICYSLSDKYSMPTYSMQNFDILASLCSWTDWFENNLIGDPEERFSHYEAYTL